jgi:hypothetical protein
VVGPGGGSASAGAGRGSYTTAGGTNIQYGGAGRTATGPGGATAGRGAGAVQVTTPGGRTATRAGTAGGVEGPRGNAAVGGSRAGSVVGPSGAVAGGSRVGAASGPYGVRGAAGGAAVAGHRTNFVAAGTLATRGGYVRSGFTHYNTFTNNWYTAHPGAWRAAAWNRAAFWTPAAWSTVATTCGYVGDPIVYDYGSSVVYEGDQVYYEGVPIATAEEYTTQATQLADTGQAAKVDDKEEWVSLGVFGMVQGDEKDANTLFQLAVNKDGVIRGNYYDALTDTTLPVYGSVDRKTQRAAWTVGDRKGTVYETGLGNLTQAETALLVHFGKDRTQQWTLIRMDPPPEDKEK